MIRRILPICPLLFVLSTTGCLFRSHKVENHISSAVLKSATQQELIDIVNKDAAQIKTMNATVDIRAAAGGQKKGKVTEYTEIRGYILAEKPTMLRMIGLFPVVRNRAFDMVSDGANFKLWIPPKNKFIVGRNDVIKPNPSQPLENLRPQHIYDALLLPEIDPKNEIAVLEGGTEQVTDPKTHKPLEQANYVLNVIRHDPEGRWMLSRKIFFAYVDTVDLYPFRDRDKVRRRVQAGFNSSRYAYRIDKCTDRAFAVRSSDLDLWIFVLRISECGQQLADILKAELHRRDLVAERKEVAF